jgi:hypothetical protein
MMIALTAELAMQVAPALPTSPVTESTAQIENVSCAESRAAKKFAERKIKSIDVILFFMVVDFRGYKIKIKNIIPKAALL